MELLAACSGNLALILEIRASTLKESSDEGSKSNLTLEIATVVLEGLSGHTVATWGLSYFGYSS